MNGFRVIQVAHINEAKVLTQALMTLRGGEVRRYYYILPVPNQTHGWSVLVPCCVLERQPWIRWPASMPHKVQAWRTSACSGSSTTRRPK